MIFNTIQRIEAEIRSINEISIQLFTEILSIDSQDGNQVDVSTIVPDTTGTIGDFSSRLNFATTNATNLVKIKNEKLILLPKNHIQTIEKQLKSINSDMRDLLDQYNSIKNTPISRIDLPGIIFIRADNGTPAIELGSIISKIDNSIDSVINLTNSILYTNQTLEKINKNDFFKILNNNNKNVLSLSREIKKIRQASKSNNTHIENYEKISSEQLEKINLLAEQIEGHKENIEKIETELNKNFEQVDNEHKTSLQTMKEIESLNDTIKYFHENINERNNDFIKGKENLNNLISNSHKEIELLKSRIKSLLSDNENISNQSKEILGNATAAGLSSKFRDARSSIRIQIIISHLMYYFSIFFLFASVLVVLDAVPILSNIIQFPPLKPPENSETSSAVLFIFGSLLTRFVVLLPSILLSNFASRWHKGLQRLNEEYMHKESIAASVPGFKEQSGSELENAIAAAAFATMVHRKSDTQEHEATTTLTESWIEKLIQAPVINILHKATDIDKKI